jgi:creatinine amidohydrolase
MEPDAIRFDRLTAPEAAELLARGPVALLPLGAIESHGDHLPLATDNVLAEGVAARVAARVPDSVVLPTVSYGQVWSTSAYAGTISLSLETMTGLLAEIGASLHAQGVRVLAFVNGHMGNLDAMKLAARRLHDELGMRALTLTYPGIDEVAARVLDAPRVHRTYFHACELETSYMLYVAPDEVRMERARPNYPELPPDFDVTPTPWHEISPTTPVLGDPTLATREKGEAVIEAAVEAIVGLIEHARAESR